MNIDQAVRYFFEDAAKAYSPEVLRQSLAELESRSPWDLIELVTNSCDCDWKGNPQPILMSEEKYRESCDDFDYAKSLLRSGKRSKRDQLFMSQYRQNKTEVAEQVYIRKNCEKLAKMGLDILRAAAAAS